MTGFAGERGTFFTSADCGGATLPASNGATAYEIVVPDGAVAVIIGTIVATRVTDAATGTGSSGDGKTQAQGTQYAYLPAAVVVEIPVVGFYGRKSLYLCANTTSASTFSFSFVRGGEK